MTARQLRLCAAVCAAALLSIAILAPAASAAPAKTSLVMQPLTKLPVDKANPESVMVIGATLTAADGKPLSNERVEFLMATDILGKKLASIGTATTDSGGSARTTFVVTRSGAYDFSARFAGSDAGEAAQAPPVNAALEALAVEGEAHEQLQLNRIGRWVPWAGLSLVVAVWATLVYVMASVLLVVPRAARRETRRG